MLNPEAYGLLGPGDQSMGLLGGMSPQREALLQMGLAMLTNSGPSAQPKSFGQILGQGGMAGLDSYNKGRQIAIQNAMAKRQMARQDRDEARSDRRLELDEMRLGMGSDDPASVATYKYYTSLDTPEQKADFMNLLRGGKVVDVGGVPHLIGADNKAIPLSTLDEEVTGKEAVAAAGSRGQAVGGAQGEAIAELPAAELEVEKFTSLIDNVITHPGLPGVVGVPNLEELVPGSDEANFKALLEQVEGGAFLQAVESLRGGGQISEIEGQKAAQAIIRAQKSQSEDEFVRSMLEAKYWAQRGLEVARRKAGQPDSAKQQQVMRYDPSTGTVR